MKIYSKNLNDSFLCYNNNGDNMKKIIYIILLFGLISLIIYDNFRTKKFTSSFNYLDTSIIIEFYSNDKKIANEALSQIEAIYQKYHKLTNRYDEYDNIINLYTIRHNFKNDNSIQISEELYNLIEYGIKLYEESNGIIDISIGNVTEVWKTYLETKIGIPSQEELKLVHNQNINNVILLENNKIKNNHINIDLDSIKNGYVADIISNYLKEKKITKYYINAGDVIVTGSPYQKENYHVALTDSDSKAEILTTIEIKNKAIVTKNILKNAFSYQNKQYHSNINSNTLYPNDNVKSVTVIADTAKEAEKIANILFSMNVEEGKKYINDLDNIEVIWVTNNDETIKTDGIEKF